MVEGHSGGARRSSTSDVVHFQEPQTQLANRHRSSTAMSAQPAASALTEAAVQRTMGGEVGATTSVASMQTGASGLIVPTRKDNSDSTSMYSMSQSVLPMDPRDRIYYRPRRHLLQCYMERRKAKGGFLQSLVRGKLHNYFFFLDHTNDFVLAGIPRPSSKKSDTGDVVMDEKGQKSYAVSKGSGNVVFSINQQQLDGDACSFVGKLSRRNGGVEMVMYSEGSNASRKEIAAILMENFGDTAGCAFRVLLPAIDAESGFIKPLEGGEMAHIRDGRGGGTPAGASGARDSNWAMEDSSDDDVEEAASVATHPAPVFPVAHDGTGAERPKTVQQSSGGSLRLRQKKWRSHSLLAQEYRRNPRSPNLIVLETKKPEWDGTLRGYKLDFHGRASKASEKNFQLVVANEPSKVVMLLGKQGDDRFAVDFRYPLCGIQAAAIATTVVTARKIIP